MSPSDSATHLYGGEDQPSGMAQPKTVSPRDPEIAWRPMPDRGGLTFKTLANPKLCLHTTETGFGWGGDPADGGPGPQYPYPPHFTVDYGPDGTWRRRWQHVDVHYGAYALKSGSSCGSANYQLGPVYQIEHIGWAKDVNGYPDAWYRGVAEEVVWHHEHLGVPLVYPDDWSSGGRMSCEEFRAFSGVHGHVHAPAPNTHWDAPFDIPRLSGYVDELLATPTEPEPIPDPWEDFMASLSARARAALESMSDRAIEAMCESWEYLVMNPPDGEAGSESTMWNTTRFYRVMADRGGVPRSEPDRVANRVQLRP